MSKNTLTNIVIATIRPWNIERAKRWAPPAGYRAHLIADPAHLTLDVLSSIKPRYVLFPHWSTIIPEAVFSQFECIVFHMTDLPFGRGGSPLQNLLVRGIYQTKISALRVEAGVDTGPIYLKHAFDIHEGSAEELFDKASEITFSMIEKILLDSIKPQSQQGEAVVFKRRKPEESRIPENCSGRALYDFVRMLDAPEYPHAFIEKDMQRFEFSKAVLESDNTVKAEVIIGQKEELKT